MMHRIFFAFIWIIGRVLLWIYRVDVKGLENLPKHSVLLCPNHSTDLDPVLIGLCLPLDYHLHFMAKAELFDNRALAWLIRTLGAFPVQRDGKDIQSIKTAMQVLHKGENLLIFPEGTTIRGRRWLSRRTPRARARGHRDDRRAHGCDARAGVLRRAEKALP